MGVVEPSQNLELSLNFLENAILTNLLLVQDLYCYFMPSLLMEGH